MKKGIIVLQWIIIVLLILTLFFRLLAVASGHKIPVKTNVEVGAISLIFVVLPVVCELIKRKIR